MPAFSPSVPCLMPTPIVARQRGTEFTNATKTKPHISIGNQWNLPCLSNPSLRCACHLLENRQGCQHRAASCLLGKDDSHKHDESLRGHGGDEKHVESEAKHVVLLARIVATRATNEPFNEALLP
uniref:Uncharacterized protein n=1 Tax=Arundo donax TaxID=35708 RepID=A0A0A9D0N0_ARUDO